MTRNIASLGEIRNAYEFRFRKPQRIIVHCILELNERTIFNGCLINRMWAHC
jgi:hypothetical protein